MLAFIDEGMFDCAVDDDWDRDSCHSLSVSESFSMRVASPIKVPKVQDFEGICCVGTFGTVVIDDDVVDIVTMS